MLKRLGLLTLAAVAMAGTGLVFAQSGHQGQHGQHGQHGSKSPYAALTDRPIKALSPEQEADLRQGRGMGLALAAELNGYPGPMHVLELADALSLTQAQKSLIEAHFQRMKSEATTAGEKIIELETMLDRQFSTRAITAESLQRLTTDIGERQASLRATHLGYHLETVAILSPEQVALYNKARGYAR